MQLSCEEMIYPIFCTLHLHVTNDEHNEMRALPERTYMPYGPTCLGGSSTHTYFMGVHEVLPAVLMFMGWLECLAGPHDIDCEACMDSPHALAAST